jgi:hypothetical protein
MIVEYAQILSTIHHVNNSFMQGIYKPTHRHHPSVLWVGKSKEHYTWLWQVAMHLCDNYSKVKGSLHKTESVLRTLKNPPDGIGDGWKDVTQVCGSITRPTALEAYREYYRLSKVELHDWKYSQKPEWI